jgi:hypothetical protein
MSGVRASDDFAYYRGEVEVMLSYGCALETIEGVLERAPLDDENRDALWLMAWALDENADGEPAADLQLVRG